jgi:hypothetical protein
METISSPILLAQQQGLDFDTGLTKRKYDAFVTEIELDDIFVNGGTTPHGDLEHPSTKSFRESTPSGVLHEEAWTSAVKTHVLETVLHGATVTDPTVAIELPALLADIIKPCAPQTIHPKSVPDGFVVSGSIEPFGNEKLTADFWSYHGPRPPWLTLSDPRTPVYQMATMRNDLRLSSIFSSLEEEELDLIALKEVAITYQVDF